MEFPEAKHPGIQRLTMKNESVAENAWTTANSALTNLRKKMELFNKIGKKGKNCERKNNSEISDTNDEIL
jgi:hypothetical protein